MNMPRKLLILSNVFKMFNNFIENSKIAFYCRRASSSKPEADIQRFKLSQIRTQSGLGGQYSASALVFHISSRQIRSAGGNFTACQEFELAHYPGAQMWDNLQVRKKALWKYEKKSSKEKGLSYSGELSKMMIYSLQYLRDVYQCAGSESSFWAPRGSRNIRTRPCGPVPTGGIRTSFQHVSPIGFVFLDQPDLSDRLLHCQLPQSPGHPLDFGFQWLGAPFQAVHHSSVGSGDSLWIKNQGQQSRRVDRLRLQLPHCIF